MRKTKQAVLSKRPLGCAVAVALGLAAWACAGSEVDSIDLPYAAMADRIVSALQPAPGENVIVRFDAEVLPGFSEVLSEALESAGAGVVTLSYGPVDGFDDALAAADAYVWLPVNPPDGPTAEQTGALIEWLDQGRGRQVHFHWGGGTMDPDGLVGEHSSTYDSIYVEALDIDYVALSRAQEAAITLLRSGPVRVTTPAGTDVTFLVGDRHFNLQNGDASRERMTSARIRIDREIELPAGVIRVAPLEESVNGTLVVPRARFGDGVVEQLRLTIVDGVVTDFSADAGAEVFQAALDEAPALSHFRELGLGFNPRLIRPEALPWLPYYGYGAGVVRLSLGNNEEIGGSVGGTGVRWLFFPDATVAVGDAVLVRDGVLQ